MSGIPLKVLTGEIFTAADQLGIGTPVISPRRKAMGIGVGEVGPRWYPGLDKQNNLMMSYGTKIIMNNTNPSTPSSFGFEGDDFVVRVQGAVALKISSLGTRVNGIFYNGKDPSKYISDNTGLGELLYPQYSEKSLLAVFSRPIFAGYHRDDAGYYAFREISSFLTKFKASFTRSSVGTYYDDEGKLRLAGENEPRLGHKPYSRKSRGLIFESASQNLVTYSYDFGHWTTNHLSDDLVYRPEWYNTGLDIPFVLSEGVDTSPQEHSLSNTFSAPINTPISGSFFFSMESTAAAYFTFFVSNSDRSKLFGINVNVAIDGTMTATPRTVGTGALTFSEIERISDKIYRCKMAGTLDAASSNNTPLTLTGLFASTNASGVLSYQSGGLSNWIAINDFQFETRATPSSYLKNGSTLSSHTAETLIIDLKHYKFDPAEGTFQFDFIGNNLAMGTIIATLRNPDSSHRVEVLVTAVDNTAKTYTVGYHTVIDGVFGSTQAAAVLPQKKCSYVFTYANFPTDLSQLYITSANGFSGSFTLISYA